MNQSNFNFGSLWTRVSWTLFLLWTASISFQHSIEKASRVTYINKKVQFLDQVQPLNNIVPNIKSVRQLSQAQVLSHVSALPGL